ncbi:hypothetical protein ACSBR1_001101 [Camellia fascicularis]
MFFINVDRSSNNPRFEAQTHRTQPQQFALTVLHQSQRSLFFINLEANRVRTRHQMVQTPFSSFITASTADLMSSSLVHFSLSTFSLSNGSGWKLDFRINLFQCEQEVLNNLLQSLSYCNLGDHLLCYCVDPLEFKKQCHIQKFRIEVIQREPWEHIEDEDIKKNYCILLWGDMASSSNVFCHQIFNFALSLALLRASIGSFKQVSFEAVFGIKFSATSQGLISVSCNKLSLFCR